MSKSFVDMHRTIDTSYVTLSHYTTRFLLLPSNMVLPSCCVGTQNCTETVTTLKPCGSRMDLFANKFVCMWYMYKCTLPLDL